MSDAEAHALSNPKEAAILKLIQDKIAARLTQLENERAANDSSIESWQSEVNGYTEIANRFVEELEKLEAQAQEAAKPNINIDISEDHTPTAKKVPLTTRETKTGPLHKGPGAKPGDTPTNGTKSDKAQSLNEVPEEKKTNTTQKRPVPTPTPKPTTKAEKPEKTEKPAVPKVERPVKKPTEVKKPGEHEEKKEGEATAEGSAESQEKAPEPTNVEECLTAIKALNKKLVNDSADLISTTSDPAGKVLEAVSIILGEKTDTESVKRLVKAADFVKKLEGVNAESISNQNFTKAKNILKLPKFQPENIKSKNNAIVLYAKWAHFILKIREAKAQETAEANGAHPEEEKINAHPEESKTDATEEAGGIISKADVAALKAKKNPPAPVNAVLDATCIALKLAPKHIGGKKTYDHGALLNTADLIKKINSLDITKVPRDTVKKLREYTEKDDFKPEKVEAVPGAAGLCKWILSIIERDDKNPAPEPTPKTEKPASTEKPAPEKTEKPATATGTKKPAPATGAGTKKDEKKEEKKEEKKPVTPAPAKGKPATTTPATGAGAKAGAKKEEGPAAPEFAELKAVLKPLRITDVTSLRGLATPAEPVPKVFNALSHLLHNKDIAWKDATKAYLADLATLQKSLHVDVPALPQVNVDAAKKIIADNKIDEASLKPKSPAAAIIFNWIEAAIKLHEQRHAEGGQAAPAEEHKEEEPKEAAATETKEAKEATPQKAENKEAATPEKIPVQETPAVTEHKEEPAGVEQPKVEEEQPKVEEQPVVVEQPKAEEPKVEEQLQAEEQPKVEEKQQEQVNGDHAAEPVAEHNAEEAKSNHVEVDSKQVISDLSELLGYNVETEVTDGNVKEYIQGKVREIETQISSATNQNGELRREGVQESPEKKPYEVKESTKGFIEMVEPGWVSELLDNQNWDEKIYQILVLFFLVQGNTDAPDVNDKEAVRAYAAGKLKAEEGNIVGYFLGVEKRLEIDTATKVKIQEYVKDKSAILNPNTFDGVDGLCGVISFLMKEISEYLGVIPLENAKKISAKEKIYLLNNEKIEFYNQRENKIIEIAHKHGVVLDS